MVVTQGSCSFVSLHLNSTAALIVLIGLAFTLWYLFQPKIIFATYYWLRSAVIVYCVLVQCIIMARLRQLKSHSLTATALNKADSMRLYVVLGALVDKMQYYPLVQVVTRAGAVWLEAS